MAPPDLERIRLEELTPELKGLLEPRVARLGYLGEFFAIAAQQPDALAHFHRFTESLKAVLPWRVTEVIALTVAALTGNGYERVQHERLALTLEMDRETVAALAAGKPEDARLDDVELTVAALAKAMVDGSSGEAQDALARLTELTGGPFAVGCTLLVGRYLAHAAIGSAFGVRPPVLSPFANDATTGLAGA